MAQLLGIAVEKGVLNENTGRQAGAAAVKAGIKLDKKQAESKNMDEWQTPAVKKLLQETNQVLGSISLRKEDAVEIHDKVIDLCQKNKQKQALELIEEKVPALKSLETKEISKDDPRLYLVNDFFYAALGAKEYERGARLADDPKIQALAELNSFVFHNTACIYAKLGKLDKALDQVKKAKKFGYPHMDKIASDTELAALYGNPEFKKLTGRR